MEIFSTMKSSAGSNFPLSRTMIPIIPSSKVTTNRRKHSSRILSNVSILDVLTPYPGSSVNNIRPSFKSEKKKRLLHQQNHFPIPILHPSIDKFDDSGELAQMMLLKWKEGADESAFSSNVLYCDIKLQEAKRITSLVQLPNRFLTCVSIQLLYKLARGMGSSGQVVIQLTAEILRSIYRLPDAQELPDEQKEKQRSSIIDRVDSFIPYYAECKQLRNEVYSMGQEMEKKEKHIIRLTITLQRHKATVIKALQKWKPPPVHRVFYKWATHSQHMKQMDATVKNLFTKHNTHSLKNVFREWRITSLRNNYKVGILFKEDFRVLM